MDQAWRLVERDGKLYLRYADTLSDKPIRVANYWLMGRRYDAFGPDPIPQEGFPVRACGNGVYEAGINGATGARLRLVLPGDKACDFTEEAPVPSPRTRQPTRWYLGRWEKFTKRGWHAA